MSPNDDLDPPAEGTAPGPLPRLPERASIYIDVDGTVHFGALFEGLVPVADALGNRGGADATRARDAGQDVGSDETAPVRADGERPPDDAPGSIGGGSGA